MEKVAVKLHEWLKDIDLVVTSPYTRARETADIISQVLAGKKVIEAPELVPQSPPKAFLNWLKAHARDQRCILAVGHEPHISSFLSYLISGQEEAIVEMKKSAVACLEFESFQDLAPGRAQLNWLVPPKLIID